ncbi:C40 family peptidase [Blastococcus goldschmidtiae]|uniref:NlpC/P60 family protein n=1 Tax=Blastococcus goldschmidtiae TaxID=3075546 RepID=A0ABU2K903_9ACTN|nr:NlpC/P60 family protein [Blastococcus sp. DSM 46792]MDT0276675.1 NlpC/P60 family protein [Blastococcus sp. DSM 46792]
MTTTRTSTITRRSFRGAALALLTGAGIALSPLAASASPGPGAVASLPAQTSVSALTAVPTAYGVAPRDRALAAAHVAMAQRGKPYQWGGTGPGGFDCSGLVYSSFRALGVNVPRTSRAQSTAGHYVSRADLRAGDLIFFYSPVGHVGIYLGYGVMVHSSTYGKPVSIVPVSSVPGYNTARRVA